MAAIADLRAALQKLERRRRAQEKQATALRLPGEIAQLKTVLIALISNEVTLARAWVGQAQRFCLGRSISAQVDVSPSEVSEWVKRWSGHPEVKAALADLSHPWREAADRFLMESLVVDRIRAANTSGVSVPSSEVWAMLQRMWAMRPQSAKTKAWLLTLAGSSVSRRSYLQKLRRRWLLTSGVLERRPGLSVCNLKHKAPAEHFEGRLAVHVRHECCGAAERCVLVLTLICAHAAPMPVHALPVLMFFPRWRCPFICAGPGGSYSTCGSGMMCWW